MNDRIGIVVVTYNSADFIGPCLEAALRASRLVAVVDNASVDGTAAIARRYEGVKVIANQDNRGFAAAVNQGARALGADYILLLNPDAILTTALEPLIRGCDEPGMGAATGQLIHPTGEAQFGFTVRRLPTKWTLAFEVLGLNRIFPRNRVNRRYRCDDLNLNQAQRVEQPAGAFLLVRRSVWEELGGLDEQFHPLWFEDVDFLERMRQAGYGVWYDPVVQAIHHGGHSVANLAPAERHKYWYDNLLRYAGKHFRCWEVRMIAAAVLAGAMGRMVTGKAKAQKTGDDFPAVMRLALDVLTHGPRPVGATVRTASVNAETTETRVKNTQSNGLH